MSDGPFGTTGLRRFWTFVVLWGATITSIIFYITTPRADGVLSVLQVVGIFYYRSQVALDEFAAAATVPEWVVLLAYSVLAAVLLAIAVGVLVLGTTESRSVGSSATVVLLVVTTGVIAVSAVLLTATLSGSTIVVDLVGVALQVTPPILTLSPIAVVISVVTAYVS